MPAKPIRAFFVLSLVSALVAGPVSAFTARASAAQPDRPAKSLLDGLELYQVSIADSPIEFSIASMGLSRVRGTFSDFSESLTLDPRDLTRSSVTLVIRTKSLTTFNDLRDHDLKGEGWFDVEKYPTAVFVSRDIVKQGDGYLMHGSLSLHGHTRDIDLPFAMTGQLKNVNGLDWAGFEGHATLNRKDFGIVGPPNSNALIALGKAIVADDVDLRLAVEATRPARKDTLSDRGADSLWHAVLARGVAPVVNDFRALRTAAANATPPASEAQLNAVGYQLVEHGRAEDGLELFKLQFDAFPQSASGLTGMAYADALLGDREGAVANALKAIAMNPGATRAMEILRHVRPPADDKQPGA